jgi:hypothetical protein
MTCQAYLTDMYIKNVILIMQQTGKARKVVNRLGSLIFWTVGSQMALRLSSLSADRAFPNKVIFWYSFLLKVE